MHADLFYLLFSKYISTIIHTPCEYGFVLHLKLQSFCLWISISHLCLCFCYAKSLNKEVISWITFLFVLSSIFLFQSKKAQSTLSNLNNELSFYSYNHRATSHDSSCRLIEMWVDLHLRWRRRYMQQKKKILHRFLSIYFIYCCSCKCRTI